MRVFIVLLFTFLILGCSTNKKTIKHSFFVAGHTYGNPRAEVHTKGLYSFFMDKVPFINEQHNMDFGFLLGDIVWMPNAWPEAERDISKFKMPIHVVKGNHDGKLDFFINKFGETYKKFMHKGNLYVILDSTMDKWNISGDQLVFLINALRVDGRKANNIFILAHHLLWYSKDEFPNPIPNSSAGKASKTNFWSKIEPLLKNQKKPIYLFAGDMGAFPKKFRKQKNTIEYFYYNYENITFVGTGVGGGVRDNFVIVDILKDQTIKFRLIHLNGNDINGIGKLEDFQLLD